MFGSTPENLVPGNDPATMDGLHETIKYVHSSQDFISGNRYRILRSIAEGTVS
jgi:hypothetical protein